MQSGISVAQLAHENSINDNLLLNWRPSIKGLLAAWDKAPGMLPVMLAAEFVPEETHPQSLQIHNASCCELVLPRFV